MRVAALFLFVFCAPWPASAQQVLQCTVAERVAEPPGLHDGTRWAVEMRDGWVRMVLRRTASGASQVIDLVAHQRIPGASYQVDIARSGLSADAVMWMAMVREGGTILFDEFNAIDDNGRRSSTRLTVILRCPNAR